MATLEAQFFQDKELTNKSTIGDKQLVTSASHQDDDALSAATSCGDGFQSSPEDSSQGEHHEIDNAHCDTWKTNSFWDDRAEEIMNPPVIAMCPTLVAVPVMVNMPAPCMDLCAEDGKVKLLQQAEEYKMMAAQFEAEARKLKNPGLDFSEEHLVAHDSIALSEPQVVEGETTVMIRNIPNNVTRSDLLDRLASHGFQFSFDFVYLPMDFKRDANLGYAFVNFVSPGEAARFYESFNGFSNWGCASNKVSEVCWGCMHGLYAHVERYRNSPVMHKDVPDEHKPVIFHEGQRLAFPPPTKRLRAPRMK